MTDNLDTARRALEKELGTPVADAELEAYLARVQEVVAAAQALRGPHKAAIARLASRKSREKRAAEVAEMRARLARLEGRDS